MTKKYFLMGLAAIVMATSSCTTHYAVSGISRTRVMIDQQYDKAQSLDVSEFMKPYKSEVDKLMAPVLGQAATPLEAFKPESPLGNLMPDVLVWAGKLYQEKPDFGVYNIGGIRASLAQGNITIGDIYDVAPFENKITFVTLTGEKVIQLMKEIVSRKGEGISKEVHLVVDKDHQLKHVTISGKEIDPKSTYRIATIDYVSHGNDGMLAFKDATERRELTGKEDLTREVFMKYIKEINAQGKAVEGKIEGRFKVEE